MFDPKREHGQVSPPVAGAIWYQDGHYWDADHRYVFSNPGLAAPPGIKQLRTMEEAEIAFAAAERARTEAPVAVAPVAAAPAAPSAPAAPPAAPPESGTTLTREQQLNQLPFPKLQRMQLMALQALHPGVEDAVLKKQLIHGAGSKERVIKWLLENTSE